MTGREIPDGGVAYPSGVPGNVLHVSRQRPAVASRSVEVELPGKAHGRPLRHPERRCVAVYRLVFEDGRAFEIVAD